MDENNVYQLLRDSKVVSESKDYIDLIHYIHEHHSYSFDHALKYESYRVIKVPKE